MRVHHSTAARAKSVAETDLRGVERNEATTKGSERNAVRDVKLTVVASEVCLLAVEAGAVRLLFLGAVTSAGCLGGGLGGVAGGVEGALALARRLFVLVGYGGGGGAGESGGCS